MTSNSPAEFLAPLPHEWCCLGTQKQTWGMWSAKKARGISNYNNNIHVAASRQPGTMPADVEAAYGSLKGRQTHKFKEWKRTVMATKYFSVMQPGVSLIQQCLSKFRTIQYSQIEGKGLNQCGPPSGSCFNSRKLVYWPSSMANLRNKAGVVFKILWWKII